MDEEKMTGSKALVCCSNMIFLMSGFALMSLGILLMIDNERVLMSKLLGSIDEHPDQPLFYYLAIGIVGVGFLISITGLLGCWASCLFNCCITVTYVGALILLILGEFSICLLTVFWPDLLGVDVRPSRLIRTLQRNYALPGQEQFTAALDLAQTTFSCCGINGSYNYGISWWRLQEVSRRELIVPLTCCTLNNTGAIDAFLNPEPKNLALCQTRNPEENQRARHSMGCLDMIEKWTQDQALLFLGVALVLMLIEICALLSTILACTKKKSKKKQINQILHQHKH